MWSDVRPRWIVFALICEITAVVVTVASLWGELDSRHDLIWFSVLLVMGVAQAEMSRQIERVRRWMGGQTHINVTSVWYLAGVVLLAPGWAALLSAALYVHLWIRVWRQVSTRPAHRVIASTTWALLSCWLAAVTLQVTGLGILAGTPPNAARGAAIVLVAAAVFELVNLLLVAASICLYTRQRSLTDVVGTWSDNMLELVTLCLGGLTATALVYQPILVLLIYPPLLLLHRHVLIKQLEVAVATDEKTGLFNTNGWHHLANRELTRAQRTSSALAVFMIDIDHFKKINDTYGHLAGDAVLKAVAAAITNAVRDYDAVGRFGGEEFVVLLPDLAGEDISATAERVRHAVTQLAVPLSDESMQTISGLSVSIGTATYPAAGSALDRIIHAADTALLRAKRTGRNRVEHSDSPNGSAAPTPRPPMDQVKSTSDH
ncbi:diguanylate cyclase (GGDEF)-like protein [Herbihabitans rhizosphaerae]|uniref:Diguanylate cyclase (GGDEF)-like protein n=1 Tax=Herbihabitans rhizosphaerae TaxID=1872711 RepID=A0A4Q7L216_9PSEU|nr:GGDEF domain-containing protein [Herbihabitans rhizosphaerae]RZS43164.1 diguanylate cyclase (GGDEF)-like protein [Herbihabitans rhizosphaerae]